MLPKKLYYNNMFPTKKAQPKFSCSNNDECKKRVHVRIRLDDENTGVGLI